MATRRRNPHVTEDLDQLGAPPRPLATGSARRFLGEGESDEDVG